MTDLLPLLCYAAGAFAFGRFFWLAPRLRSERMGAPPTKLQRWLPWLPGQFTPTGEKLYKQMNRLLLVGWVAFFLGMILQP